MSSASHFTICGLGKRFRGIEICYVHELNECVKILAETERLMEIAGFFVPWLANCVLENGCRNSLRIFYNLETNLRRNSVATGLQRTFRFNRTL
jgi:hypothetical protein